MPKDDRWKLTNAARLEVLAEGLRADLWRSVGLRAPLPPGELLPWLLARVAGQEVRGDRVRLHLPAGLALEELKRQEARASDSDRLHALRDPRVLPIRTATGLHFHIDTYAGAYLKSDLGDQDERVWPDPYSGRKVHPLALVALAARDVARVTGCGPEAAPLFLLCDLPCGQPVRFRLSSDSGLSLWVYDPFMTAEDLSAEYVAQRRLFIPRTRPKRPQQHTLELIRLVRRMRPERGRNPSNSPWSDVLERWNAKHPRTHRYADEASISRAYSQALKRRRELGLLRELDEQEETP